MEFQACFPALLAIATGLQVINLPTPALPLLKTNLVEDAKYRTETSFGRDGRDPVNKVSQIRVLSSEQSSPVLLQGAGLDSLDTSVPMWLITISYVDGIGEHVHSFAYSSATHGLISDTDTLIAIKSKTSGALIKVRTIRSR